MAIETHTKEAHANALARYLPNGVFWEAKNRADSELRQWINGSSLSYKTAEAYLKILYDEYPPDLAVSLLDEWESMLGIPDSCFPAGQNDDERRLYICLKLMARGAQTVADFQALADKLGVSATVIPGADAGFSKFTLVVEYTVSVGVTTFPLPFPIPFELSAETILRCLFSQLKPAISDVVFIEV